MYKWKRRCFQKSSKLASILTSHPSRPAELTQPKKTALQEMFRKYFASALNIVRLPPPLWWLGGLRGWSGVEEGSGSTILLLTSSRRHTTAQQRRILWRQPFVSRAVTDTSRCRADNDPFFFKLKRVLVISCQLCNCGWGLPPPN